MAAFLLMAPPVLSPASAQDTPYQVSMTGVENDEVRNLLEATGALFRLRDNPPPSPIGLRQRAESDRSALLTALHSLGYYEASVDIRVDTEKQPAQVTIAVSPGPAYRFDDVAVVGPDGAPVPGFAIDRAALGLERGAQARARAVVDAQGRLERRFAARGYAFAKVTDRTVVVDRADQTMDITYVLDTGPLVHLGEARIQGLKTVKEATVRRRIPWKPGTLYDPALMEEARQDVAALGTFAAVRVELPEAPGPGGLTPVTVVVEERPPHVVGFGVEYSSIDGLGTNAYWRHRNLFGGAESLNLSAEVTGIGAGLSADGIEEIGVGADIEYRSPDFLVRDQTLVLHGQILREDTDAYIRESIIGTSLLELAVRDNLTLGYGLRVEETRIRENGESTLSTLFGLPLTLALDASNSLLNPTSGYRINAEVTPYQQLGGEGSTFVIGRVTNTGYYDVAGNGDWVLAGRVSVGSIAGVDGAEAIPAHLRFYAGGGGSVRGYGYQDVGPRDASGDPRGGLSLFEASAEMRVKVTDTIGVVPFVDAGNVYETTLPNFSGDLKWSAGLGLRYFTGFGPLRLDVAVPINPEPEDETWAFYLSIGQAF